MIRTLSISNFKSVEDLSIGLGRVSVLIGENGSGKSNILEGIALLGAAASGRLENEFLITRGIRVTDADAMFSAFRKKRSKKPSKSQKVHLIARNESADPLDLKLT